jgi:predicted enzyme related to lactoylglutathione lyase
MGRPVVEFQILAKDPARAEAFYTKLFGWSVDRDNALGYRRIDTGTKEGIRGGIWPSPPEGHSFVQLFVDVEDVAQAVERARSLGGSVVLPPQKLPEGDEMAVILDPEGIPVALTRRAAKRR